MFGQAELEELGTVDYVFVGFLQLAVAVEVLFELGGLDLCGCYVLEDFGVRVHRFALKSDFSGLSHILLPIFNTLQLLLPFQITALPNSPFLHMLILAIPVNLIKRLLILFIRDSLLHPPFLSPLHLILLHLQ